MNPGYVNYPPGQYVLQIHIIQDMLPYTITYTI